MFENGDNLEMVKKLDIDQYQCARSCQFRMNVNFKCRNISSYFSTIEK